MAARVAAMLRSHGVPVWYSETNLLGAQQCMMKSARLWRDAIGLSFY